MTEFPSDAPKKPADDQRIHPDGPQPALETPSKYKSIDNGSYRGRVVLEWTTTLGSARRDGSAYRDPQNARRAFGRSGGRRAKNIDFDVFD